MNEARKVCGFCPDSLGMTWPRRTISREIFHADASTYCVTLHAARRERRGEISAFRTSAGAHLRDPHFEMREDDVRAAILSRTGALSFYFREDRFRLRRGSVDNGSTGS